MELKNKLVVFTVDNQQFAIHLSNVERIVNMVQINPLPLAPEYISGTINFQGEFLAVLNVRKLFLLSQKEIDLSDQLIITQKLKNKVVLWIDSVSEIIERLDEEIIKTDKILLDVGYVEGLFRLNDGMVLINDLDKFLIPEEIAKLTEALTEKRIKEEEKEKEITKVKTKEKAKIKSKKIATPVSRDLKGSTSKIIPLSKKKDKRPQKNNT